MQPSPTNKVGGFDHFTVQSSGLNRPAGTRRCWYLHKPAHPYFEQTRRTEQM